MTSSPQIEPKFSNDFSRARARYVSQNLHGAFRHDHLDPLLPSLRTSHLALPWLGD